MKFALAKEHREYFARNHSIEFEGVLSLEELSTLNNFIETLLLKRLKLSNIHDATPRERYLAGRDLWRDDLSLQKIIFLRKLAEIAASLFKQPTLRIAFDQYQAETFPLSLQQMSCINPIVGALAIPLQDTKGTAIYFSPDTPLQLPFFLDPVLIIAYTSNKAQYTLKKEDLNTHSLKRLGCTFGDTLKDATHPILFR